jgi:hypothetical protein
MYTNRQRVINAQQSLFHLASHNLPRELQQLLRSNNPGYQPAYPVAQQSATNVQQPLNAQLETATGLRRTAPAPASPSHAGSKRKRDAEDEEDEDDEDESDDESLVFPEDDDY